MTDAIGRTAQWVIDWRAAREAERRARLQEKILQAEADQARTETKQRNVELHRLYGFPQS